MENEVMDNVAVEPETAPQTAPEQAQTTNNAPNAYETIIAQQQAQIEALIAQSNTLTQQITNMVFNGAQFKSADEMTIKNDDGKLVPLTPQVNASAFNPKSLAETDAFLTMEDLAKEIGKK